MLEKARVRGNSACRNCCRSASLMRCVGCPRLWNELYQLVRTKFLICARVAMAVVGLLRRTVTRAGRYPSICESYSSKRVARLISSCVVALQDRCRAASAVRTIYYPDIGSFSDRDAI